jgi:uncharacterized protein YjbI with pentapeptide repeats
MADETEPGHELPAKNPPEKYNQAFFLDLAAKGKDTWNAWQRDPGNKDVSVTFTGIDFSEAPRNKIDFSGFEFGDPADFSQCKWGGVEEEVILEDPEAFFPGRACFAGAAFGDAFGDGADFTGAAFGDDAVFIGAAFGNGADFTGADFSNEAYFVGAAFGLNASFDDACFKDLLDCTGSSKEKWRRNIQVRADKVDEKGHEESWKRSNSGPDRFLTVSFASARFDGEAVFFGRNFQMDANFTDARFYQPPVFDGADHVDRIDFTGAYISFARLLHPQWTTDTRVPLRLRAFRKIAEETKNHDLERDLYIEERKAERGLYLNRLFKELKRAPIMEKPLIFARLLGHSLWIIVMFGYWALANYGRSFMTPLAWLVLSDFIFHFGYASILSPLKQKVDPTTKDYYDQAVWMLALGNAVPFVGHLSIDAGIKKSLYCPDDVCSERAPIPPLGIQVLVIVQNVVSIAFIFFFGLALRNYFKIK